MLFLAKCHNEPCLSTRARQKQLHAMLFPGRGFGAEFQVPTKPAKDAAIRAAVPVRLPRGIPLDRLPDDHAARVYLAGRSFCPDGLAHHYGVAYCGRDDCVSPRISDRIVIPIFQPARISFPNPAGKGGVVLAGWQARAIADDLPDGVRKYLFGTGTRRNDLLYGLQWAVNALGPIVVVEGITDAWQVGIQAVALLGKTISAPQCRLVLRHFAGRPVVVFLDADAGPAAVEVRDKIRRARAAARDDAPVVVARLPLGRKDPGECMRAEVDAAVARALANT